MHPLASDSLRGSSVTIGTIPWRLAWPLRRDDTHKTIRIPWHLSVRRFRDQRASRHTWMDGWMDGCVHTCMHACMHAWMHTHKHTHTHKWAYAHARTRAIRTNQTCYIPIGHWMPAHSTWLPRRHGSRQSKNTIIGAGLMKEAGPDSAWWSVEVFAKLFGFGCAMKDQMLPQTCGAKSDLLVQRVACILLLLVIIVSCMCIYIYIYTHIHT